MNERTGEEQAIQDDFIWGVGPEALYQITRAEYKTEPDSKDKNKRPDTVVHRILLTETRYLPQPGIFFGLIKPKLRHRRNFREDKSK